MVEPAEGEGKGKFIKKIKVMLRLEEHFRATIEENAMGEDQVKRIVKATDGFSGREIAKLMIAFQGAIYASSSGILTSKMIEKIVQTKVEEHKVKLEMTGVDLSKYQKNRILYSRLLFNAF